MSFQSPSLVLSSKITKRAGSDQEVVLPDAAANDRSKEMIYPRQIVCPTAPGGTCRLIRKHRLMGMLGIRKSAIRRLKEASQDLADEFGEPLIVGMRYSALAIFEPHKRPKRVVLEQTGSLSPTCDTGWRRFERNLTLTKPGVPFYIAVREAFQSA